MRPPVLIVIFMVATRVLFAQEEENAPVRFAMKKHPSLRLGDWLKMDFRSKLQMDFRGYSDGLETDEGLFDPRRLRVGVEGRIRKDLEFELEYELFSSDYRLRDGFVNYRRFRSFQVQAGKFKIPFGFDQLTGPSNLNFVYRSRIGSQLTPGRDTGVKLHGSFFEKGLRYEAGIFGHDGENAEAKDNVRTGQRTVAARLTGTPAHFFPAPRVFRHLEIGLAGTHSQVPEGLNSLRGKTTAGETFFSRLYVNGARFRQGAELSWLIGSLSIEGEYIGVREQRLGQSLLGKDLPDLFSRGWYLSATHPLIGRRKDSAGNKLRDYLPGMRRGVLEVAARYEQIRFGSGESVSSPSRNPRAANVLPTSDRGLTLGLNWYANRHSKVQFNVIREVLEDPARTPVSGVQHFWSAVGRIQFVL